jgi:hypothetical protein
VGFRLDKESGFRQSWTVEKKVVRILRRIRNEPGLSADEKHLFARSLAASPDERWRMHENFLRSHDLFTRSSRKKYGFKSPA